MSDPSRQHTQSAPTATASEFIVTFAAALALILVLLAADTSLARVDRRESAAHAASLYAEGRALLDSGQPKVAVERFASAFANERSNVAYQLALGQALFADGRIADAEATLKEVLAREQTDGAANFAMARVLTRAGRTEEAKSFYHRAIYGRWGADSTHARIVSRLELIELLAVQRAKRALLAELLPMEELMSDSLALRERIAQLFIAAGSPARGANIFRVLLRENPNDGQAYRGMGEAALALGNFRTARADFLQAARLLPAETAIAARLALADTVLAISPLERGLGTQERHRRARDILTRTLVRADACAGAGASSADLAASARRMLASGVSRQQETEALTESVLALASDLFASLPTSCTIAHSASDDALGIIQAHLPG